MFLFEKRFIGELYCLLTSAKLPAVPNGFAAVLWLDPIGLDGFSWRRRDKAISITEFTKGTGFCTGFWDTNKDTDRSTNQDTNWDADQNTDHNTKKERKLTGWSCLRDVLVTRLVSTLCGFGLGNEPTWVTWGRQVTVLAPGSFGALILIEWVVWAVPSERWRRPGWAKNTQAITRFLALQTLSIVLSNFKRN